ncbi:hypothetical protein Acr_00g0089250 [Actinidia rufa]|uniref:Uncharacterized protein n=1 Tax=Actinidia rufa TaxID=165716 RepID=A0A7J0DWW5_9ERIC|nr:hypothetical protein Acr_00g0089250 [Actinidia rufa]
MHFQTEVLAPSHLGALLSPTGLRCKSERDSFRRRRCTSTLSLFSELLHGHPTLVASLLSGRTSARILKLLSALLYHSGSFKYILLVLLRLLCVPLCNCCFPRLFFLLIPLNPYRKAAPLVWILPSSRYSPLVFIPLQHFLFPVETLSVPPLALKLHRFESCISMKHVLPRSPSWISRLSCGTRLFLYQQLFVVLFAICTSPSHATCVENISLSLHKWEAFPESEIQSDSSYADAAMRTSLLSKAIIVVVAASED